MDRKKKERNYWQRTKEMDKGTAIGIHLGTTDSCVAVWQHERLEIIVNEYGNRTTPSMVAVTPSEILVGEAAKNQVLTNPQNTVFDVHRLIARRFNDPCIQSDNGQPIIQVDYKGATKTFAAEDISSMILMKMKMTARKFLGCDVKNAVITVPAYFNNYQRRAIKYAANIAGLNAMRIISEPTAAAIIYGFGTNVYSSNTEKTTLVFNLGRRAFDVSVLNIQGGDCKVEAVGKDTHLGGEDFDNRLLDHCVEQFNIKNKKQLNTNAKALQRLRSVCEREKRTLSWAVETVIDIDSLHEGLDFHIKIRRSQFEEFNADLFEKTMQIVKQCLEDAKLPKEQIDEVILVGGSTRIPKVQELLEELFQGTELCKTINPKEAVAYGAAVHAAALNIEEIPTLEEMNITTAVDNQSVADAPLSTRKEMIAVVNQSVEDTAVYDDWNGIPQEVQCREQKFKVVLELDVNGTLKEEKIMEFSNCNKRNRTKEGCEKRAVYQVFINHRGPDVKTTLASLVYRGLRDSGLAVFLDKKEIRTGDTNQAAISAAIQSASLHIAIFSKRYAQSHWCLDELSEIVTSYRVRKTKIIPVFYKVEPWELRHIERGRYASYFRKYQLEDKFKPEVIQNWKTALKQASDISGLLFEKGSDLGELVEQIVETVKTELG